MGQETTRRAAAYLHTDNIFLWHTAFVLQLEKILLRVPLHVGFGAPDCLRDYRPCVAISRVTGDGVLERNQKLAMLLAGPPRGRARQLS